MNANDLNRHRRVTEAVAALRLIDAEDIKQLDDDTLITLNAAVAARTMFTNEELRRRHWRRINASGGNAA